MGKTAARIFGGSRSTARTACGLRPLPLAAVAAAVAMVAALTAIAAAPVLAAHSDSTQSAAIYRIPYADGTNVDVTGDGHNHGGTGGNRDRIDMIATDASANKISVDPGPASAGDPAALIVAAASGTIRVIEDGHGDDYDRGDGLAADGVTPQDDSLEHSCQDAGAQNTVVAGLCQSHNNYVWIEHPNGEWTKYSHLRTGTVTIDRFWVVGAEVEVGDVLGEEGDVGFAGGHHLHFEVAELGAFTGTLPANIGSPGGFIADGNDNHEPVSCNSALASFLYADDPDGDGADDGDVDDLLVANPCVNTAPVADAGGPYVVDEGSTVQLDGTGSSDPHNAVLTYSWSPAADLDDPGSATPVYSGVDDAVDALTLSVNDEGGDVTAATALSDSDMTTVTVNNVPPTVTAAGDAIHEGGTATVHAAFSDPGTADSHTASIEWGDGTALQAVDVADLPAGVTHVYGDNGTFTVTVTITDDDGGSGDDTTSVNVANLDPAVELDAGPTVGFPGGEYVVVGAGDPLALAAEGTDAGSDDLTFTWSTGDATTYLNNGTDPDPPMSPAGIFPFAAADATDAAYAAPGAETATVILSDDDGGTDDAGAGVVVTGTAEDTRSNGWWKHQYSGGGQPHIDPVTAAGYLEVVNAASSAFSEHVNLSFDGVDDILSPSPGDRRARATAGLLVAWLEFASGAVDADADVPLTDGSSATFLDLVTAAEATILDLSASNTTLRDVEADLARVRHAG